MAARGTAGVPAFPWNQFAELALALRVPPLKLNVAVEPVVAAPALAVAVPTLVAEMARHSG
jgi:hypothetical protein